MTVAPLSQADRRRNVRETIGCLPHAVARSRRPSTLYMILVERLYVCAACPVKRRSPGAARAGRMVAFLQRRNTGRRSGGFDPVEKAFDQLAQFAVAGLDADLIFHR